MIDKPPYGDPCNSCGQCCEGMICPLMKHLTKNSLRPIMPPCPALLSMDDGRKICGLVHDPRFFLSMTCADTRHETVSKAAALLIGAGGGCDALKVGEVAPTGARTRLIRKAEAMDKEEIRRAKKVFGIP